jgi:PPOX class probable F420-dependent enzyme
VADLNIEEYLARPLLADLATVKADGSPHVAPVWFQYQNGQIRIVTQTNSVKTRNIQHEPRVSLSVAIHERPYKYVLVNGTAELSKEGIPELTRALAIHYQGGQEGNEYADRVLVEMDFYLITITPTKIISWDGED